VAKRAADQAVQIHGGNRFMDEFPVSRYWRSMKINEIGEGTSEVLRMVIAKHLGCQYVQTCSPNLTKILYRYQGEMNDA